MLIYTVNIIYIDCIHIERELCTCQDHLQFLSHTAIRQGSSCVCVPSGRVRERKRLDSVGAFRWRFHEVSINEGIYHIL